MALITVVCGAVLIGIGVAGFLPHQAATALIPAYIGAALAVLGLLSFNDRRRKHTMHAAAALGALSFAATAVMGWPKLAVKLTGGELERPAAVYSQSATALVCLVFVGLCINSFVQARRRRRAAEAGPAEAPQAQR
jgi:hypothetical protein